MLKNILLLLFSLWMSGCQNDPFINEIEIPITSDDQVYALTAAWTNQDTARVFLSQTIATSTPSDYASISNARVTLDGGGGNTDFVYNENSDFYEAEIQLLPSRNYTLNAQINDINLTATQTLPKPLQEIEIVGLEEIQTDSSILTDGSLTLNFLDRAEEDNFYIIEMKGAGNDQRQLQEGLVENRFLLSSQEIQVETNVGRRIFLTDNGVEGEQISIDFSYSSFFLIDLSFVEITVRSITKEGYDFERSSAEILETSSNPFTEPVILLTNIENGTGVFYLNSIRSFRLEL